MWNGGVGVIKDKMKTNCPFHSCYFCLMSLVLSTIWPHKSWIWKRSVGTDPEYGNKPRIWRFHVNCDTHTACKNSCFFPPQMQAGGSRPFLFALKCWPGAERGSGHAGSTAWDPVLEGMQPPCRATANQAFVRMQKVEGVSVSMKSRRSWPQGRGKLAWVSNSAAWGKAVTYVEGRENWEAFSWFWQAPHL